MVGETCHSLEKTSLISSAGKSERKAPWRRGWLSTRRQRSAKAPAVGVDRAGMQGRWEGMLARYRAKSDEEGLGGEARSVARGVQREGETTGRELSLERRKR